MSGTNPVGPYILTNYTSDTATTYKTKIDANFSAIMRIADPFLPHAQTSPNMTVQVDPGPIFVVSTQTLTEVAAQTTGTFTAPGANSRIDRIVGDLASGAITVVTGTQSASPVPPAIPSGKFPIAQVSLTSTTTSLAAANITDERVLNSIGLPQNIAQKTGSFTAGHLLVSNDGIGTVADYGAAPGQAALKAVTDNTKSTVPMVYGSVTSGNVPKFDANGSIIDSGVSASTLGAAPTLHRAVFTSSGTFTASASVPHKITVVGAGGGGGYAYGSSGGGGAAGGTSIAWQSLTNGNGYTVTVGSGGGGGGPANAYPGSAGVAGGASKFYGTSTLTGNGGNGGTLSFGYGAVGGTATGGDINIQGGDGDAPSYGNASCTSLSGGGTGGASSMGGGGGAMWNDTSSANGNNGRAYGSGGGGGQSSVGGYGGAGGTGANGIVIVEWIA